MSNLSNNSNMNNKNNTRIIAILNQKGGVGKTTVTVNAGEGLTKLGKKVLLIDLDPQANLTYSFGIPAHELEATIYEVMNKSSVVANVLLQKEDMDILPASLELSGAEIEFSSVAGREFILRELLEPIQNNYDYILIDCSPSLGLLTLNALTFATEVFIPMQTEFLALQGMSKLIKTIEIVKARLNKNLEITGIIGSRYDSRKNLNREVIDKIKEYFGDKLFSTLIRDNIAIAEAPSYGRSIFAYKADSYGAIDFLHLSQEIIDRQNYEQKQ